MTKEEAVMNNQGLIIKFAKVYKRRGVDFLDLVQAGNLGLLEAYKRYDKKKKTKFSTYAVHWIKKYIREELTKQHIVRVPLDVQTTRNKVRRAKEKYTTLMGDTPDILQISRIIDVPVERIEACDGLCYTDLTGNIEDTCNYFVSPFYREIEDIKSCFSVCNSRERVVLSSLLEDKTLEQIGDSLGCTRERVRQIRNCAIRKIRKRERYGRPTKTRNLAR